jgi:hypothetical protein
MKLFCHYGKLGGILTLYRKSYTGTAHRNVHGFVKGARVIYSQE